MEKTLKKTVTNKENKSKSTNTKRHSIPLVKTSKYPKSSHGNTRCMTRPSTNVYKSTIFEKSSSIIDKSLYPFWYNKIPFPRVSNKELLNEKTWSKHLQLASKLYENKSSLIKGTILFHGSGIIDPVKNINATNKPFFFGLDAFIAIWYITEFASKNISELEEAMNKLKKIETYIEKDKSMKKYADESKKEALEKQKLFIKSLEVFNIIGSFSIDNYPELNSYEKMLNDVKSHSRRYYFLNIYQTLQDIPYKYLSKSIANENPLDYDECKNTACMHPQFGYHIEVGLEPVELSMEFTIPANQIGNKLKLIGVYVIDVFKLNENKNNNFNKFKAIEAIVLKSDFSK